MALAISTLKMRKAPSLRRDSGERYCLLGSIGFDNAGGILADGKRRFVEHTRVSIDLSLAEVASTAGIAVLMEWASWCETREIGLVYECVRSEVLDVAQLNGVEMMLPIDPGNNAVQL